MEAKSKPTPFPSKLDLEKIRAIKLLGKGALGTVFLAFDTNLDPSSRFPFAIKVVDKSLLKHKPGAERRARWEVSLLSALCHPFLPTLLGSFEAHSLLGWAFPYCEGGDLNVVRYQQPDHVFSTSAIRFYLAEIVCALEHLHSLGIAYRDLKPENVLVQGSGHVTLTDFDLSRRLLTGRKRSPGGSDPEVIKLFKPPTPVHRKNNSTNTNNHHLARIFNYGPGQDSGLKKGKSARVSPMGRRRASFAGGQRSNSFVGTEEYVSPEVVRGEGHAYTVDWWALGVLAYEMLYGKTPFHGKNRKETFHNVLMKRPEFVGKRTALIDLIERLLEKEHTKRLGHFKGAQEIKEHEFFIGLRWDLLTEVVRPPYVPSNEDVENLTSFDIRDYFRRQRLPPSCPTSPLSMQRISSSDDETEASLTEF